MIPHARQFVLSLLLFLLVACSSGTAQQPTVVPTLTAEPEGASTEVTGAVQPLAASPTAPPTVTAPPVEQIPADTAQDEPTGATETPSPEAPTATAPPVAVNGRSADGAYFLGREDAPLTIIDYSDFL